MSYAKQGTASRVLRTLIVISLVVAGCQTPPSTPALADLSPHPDQEAWTVTLYLMDGGKQRVVVNAGRRASDLRGGHTTLDQGIHVEFSDEKGVLLSTLTAERGEVSDHGKILSAVGRVVVVNPERGRLETDSLRWSEETNRLMTDARVRLTTDKDTITGVGFEAEPNLKEWTIRRDVQGLFHRADELKKELDGQQP